MNVIGETQHPEKFVPMTIKRVLYGRNSHNTWRTLELEADGGSTFYLHARSQADAILNVLLIHHAPTYGEVG
jgi:dTDP-D-glucose 4,6-dehydratase